MWVKLTSEAMTACDCILDSVFRYKSTEQNFVANPEVEWYLSHPFIT